MTSHSGCMPVDALCPFAWPSFSWIFSALQGLFQWNGGKSSLLLSQNDFMWEIKFIVEVCESGETELTQHYPLNHPWK